MSSPDLPPALDSTARTRRVIAFSVAALVVLVALLGTGSALVVSSLTSSPTSSDSRHDDDDEDQEDEDEDDDEPTQADGRACVILPDTASSPRWEAGDRPALDHAFSDAGIEFDIQNAQGDTDKYATIAEQQLAEGCGVMILVDYQGAGVQVAADAREQGIPVIAYDRPIDGADYWVSYDPVATGELEGQSVLDGLLAAGKDPASASVVYVGGDSRDTNAVQFREGAIAVMEAGGISPAFETEGTWDGATAGVQFEQAYTALGGNVDAVWAANDTNAAAVIAVLDTNGKTIPVSGQDASIAGLQNVLLGKQVSTVYKPFSIEVAALADLAITLLSGDTPSIRETAGNGTPFVAVAPVVIGPDEVQQVVDAGDASAADICTAAVAAACAAYGVG